VQKYTFVMEVPLMAECRVIHPDGLETEVRSGSESAIYVLKGRGRFITGPHLENELPIGPGDFIYVPPDAVHQPVNDGPEPMEMVVARNAPVEILVEYQPEKARAE
jgi:uncharacterized RmlC-like cupin family protein